MSAQIESVLNETRVFPPPAAFVKQANVSGMAAYQALCARGGARLRGLLGAAGARTPALAQAVHQGAGRVQRAVLQVVRRRRAQRLLQLPGPAPRDAAGDKTAIIFEADDGEVTRVTYQRAATAGSASFANALKALGIKKGDRVVIYMPMSIEARGRHAGLRAHRRHPLGGVRRLLRQERCTSASIDAGAVAVITADEQMRGGKAMPLKAAVDEALALGGCDSVKNVMVYKRTGGDVAMERRARHVVARR